MHPRSNHLLSPDRPKPLADLSARQTWSCIRLYPVYEFSDDRLSRPWFLAACRAVLPPLRYPFQYRFRFQSRPLPLLCRWILLFDYLRRGSPFQFLRIRPILLRARLFRSEAPFPPILRPPDFAEARLIPRRQG